MTATRLIAIVAALMTALFVSACTSSSDTATSDGHTDHTEAEETVTVTGEPAGFNSADVSFVSNMIPHHEQAVELSALVPDRSTNPEILDLAVQISDAQQPEIETMRAFLVQWQENPGDATDGNEGEHGGHGDHPGMAGMVDEATMTKLANLSGPEFDTLWLQSMIAHHEGAVEMADAEVANGSNVDAKALAQGMIDAQQAEIEQMTNMLDGS